MDCIYVANSGSHYDRCLTSNRKISLATLGMTELEHIKAFLLDRGGLLNWRGIEIQADLPKFCLREFVQLGKQDAISQHLDKLVSVLKKIGYE